MLKEDILKDSVTAFTFEECVDEIERIYKKAECSIYIASLDYVDDKGDSMNGRTKFNDLKDKFDTNPKIEYKYLFYPTPKRLDSVRKNIINGNIHERNNFYASINVSVNKTKRLPFASFMIFDKKYVIIRGPGKAEPYILITHQLLCDMFVNWLDTIWDEAEKIDNINTLDAITRKIIT